MGLQKADLKDMVDHIFEIDSFKSKMGEDNNIVTISFSTKTNETAKDLVEFLEKGYSFILDADAQKIADEAAKSSMCIPIGEGENCW